MRALIKSLKGDIFSCDIFLSPGVYCGNMKSVNIKLLNQYNIYNVYMLGDLNCFPIKKDCNYKNISIFKCTPNNGEPQNGKKINDENLCTLLKCIDNDIKYGKPTLLCCYTGQMASFVMLLYLIIYRNKTIDESFKLIKKINNEFYINKSHISEIKRLTK